MSRLGGELRLHQGIGFLISTLLGSGVFIVPAIVASITGYYSWISWLGMTVLALPVLFVFSWLGKKYPHDAGTAHFVKCAFGDRLSRCISILYLSVIPVGPPVVIITGANYLSFCIGMNSHAVMYLSFFMISIIFIINFFKISITGNIQFFITVVTAGILGLVIYSGLFLNEAKFMFFDDTTVNLDKIAKSMSVIFWCFVGIEAVAHIAPEFKNPDRDFPLTVYVSIGIVVLLYALLCYSALFFSAFGNEEKNMSSLPIIINQSLGRFGASIIGFVGFMTCLGAVNLYVVSFARLLASLSDDGIITLLFSKKNRNGMPIIAMSCVLLLILTTVILKYTLTFGIETIIGCANGVFIMIYIAASLSAIKLLPEQYKIFGSVASVFCVIIAACLREDMIYACTVLGMSLFLTSQRRAAAR